MAKKTAEEKAAAKAEKEKLQAEAKAAKEAALKEKMEEKAKEADAAPAEEVPGEGTVHKPVLTGMTREQAKGARFERHGVNNQSRKIEE